MKLDSKKIGYFIKDLSHAELIYTMHVINFITALELIVKETTSDELCKRFGIKQRNYINFIKGNYNYDIYHVTTLKAWINEIELNKKSKATD